MFNENVLALFLEKQKSYVASVSRTSPPSYYWRNFDVSELPDYPMQREDLRNYCRDPGVSDLNRILSVIAWGVARSKNRRLIYENRSVIEEKVRESRLGGGPVNAYRLFREAVIPGLGPAFWTKIVHFCEPSGTGYILDKFTAMSADILMEEPLFLACSNGVTRSVSEVQYEAYCNFVQRLALRMNVHPETAELAMYGGRGHGWRAYVINNWPLRTRRS